MLSTSHISPPFSSQEPSKTRAMEFSFRGGNWHTSRLNDRFQGLAAGKSGFPDSIWSSCSQKRTLSQVWVQVIKKRVFPGAGKQDRDGQGNRQGCNFRWGLRLRFCFEANELRLCAPSSVHLWLARPLRFLQSNLLVMSIYQQSNQRQAEVGCKEKVKECHRSLL